MSVVDFSERRAAKHRPTAPQREPDFEVHAWLENGEVEWVLAGGEYIANEPNHQHRTAAVIDAAWTYSTSASVEGIDPHHRPAIWWQLTAGGHNTLLYPKTIAQGTDWRHACWLLKQWLFITRRVAVICWRMARSKA